MLIQRQFYLLRENKPTVQSVVTVLRIVMKTFANLYAQPCSINHLARC